MRLLIFVLVFLAVLNTNCKKESSRANKGNYFLNMKVGGRQVNVKNPSAHPTALYLGGGATTTIGVHAVQETCSEPGSVCFGLTIAIDQQKPGTYDSFTLIVGFTEGPAETYYSLTPASNNIQNTITIKQIERFKSMEDAGLLTGSFSGFVSEMNSANASPLAIEGEFAVPDILY